MKNIFNKLLLVVGLAIFVGSCEKDDDFATLNPDAVLTATANKTAVVLVKDDLGKDALKVTWTAPEYGFSAAVDYRVLLDVKGNNFSKAFAVSVGTNLQKTFKTEELNKILLNLGIKAKTATILDIKVVSVLSPSTIISSSVLALTATAYTDILDLSTPWGVVGSATPGSWNGPDIPFYLTSSANILVAYATLANGEIKFRTNNSWTVNYGDDGANGTLESGGANIVVTAGTYKITFNTTALTYTMEPLTWGIVGDATVNGWGGPDMKLTYDPFTDQWRAIVKLNNGLIKFRKNNSWDVNFGDTGLNGSLESGGDNIPVTAGWYLVSVDFNKLEYTLEKTNVWGLVGDATPTGWGGPDLKFTPDFSRDGYFLLKGVTMTDGNFKFRQNDDWGVNFGDNGNDGTLESGGANIPITAGVYDFELDFSTPAAPKYTKVKKS
jgi:hypothetical protein